jgi:hypothetical protein
MTRREELEDKLAVTQKIAADRQADVDRLTPKAEEMIRKHKGDLAASQKTAPSLFDELAAAERKRDDANARAAEYEEELARLSKRHP